MAKKCEICGKATATGRKVSHAHNVTSRTWEPNLRSMKALIGGTVKRIRICARCLRSGAAQRPRPAPACSLSSPQRPPPTKG
jgi:large subunit ribosomal protein L28